MEHTRGYARAPRRSKARRAYFTPRDGRVILVSDKLINIRDCYRQRKLRWRVCRLGLVFQSNVLILRLRLHCGRRKKAFHRLGKGNADRGCFWRSSSPCWYRDQVQWVDDPLCLWILRRMPGRISFVATDESLNVSF